MDVVELRQRIARGEDLHTDFKSALGTPEELAKDLVCFANTDSGALFFGVDDHRVIVGVDDPEADYVDCGCAVSVSPVSSSVWAAMVAAVRVSRPQKVCAPWRASSIRSVISPKEVSTRFRHFAMTV
ncbi:MAG: AlbA family DNA-binding domain-containing protein, partial [Egibacteraceae bacterium]